MKKENANLEAFKGLLKAQEENRDFENEIKKLVLEKTPEELARMFLIAKRKSDDNNIRANNWRKRYTETLRDYQMLVADLSNKGTVALGC